MNVWREDELTDWLDDDVSIGWFPEEVDFVPRITARLLAMAALVLGLLIVAVVGRASERA
jgi:hypothetical protein